MAAAAILDFKIFTFLTVGTVKKVELCYLGKFHRNQPLPRYGNFLIFKMAATAVLDF